jgi:hypothetical protein
VRRRWCTARLTRRISMAGGTLAAAVARHIWRYRPTDVDAALAHMSVTFTHRKEARFHGGSPAGQYHRHCGSPPRLSYSLALHLSSSHIVAHGCGSAGYTVVRTCRSEESRRSLGGVSEESRRAEDERRTSAGGWSHCALQRPFPATAPRPRQVPREEREHAITSLETCAVAP